MTQSKKPPLIYKEHFIVMKSQKKKNYSQPTVTKVKIDNEISMVMMSPVLDLGKGISFKKLNPLKWW